MLIKQDTLVGVAEGRITLAFRRWKRPTVRAGGTLLTSIGQLSIESMDEVSLDDITGADARAAGFDGLASLRAALDRPDEGAVYRVGLRLAGPDPRIALREEVPGAREMDDITARLARWDRSSPMGAWTRAALAIIAAEPAVRAGDLAEGLGLDKARFKTNVRKLKGLGLTESLEVGYRLSPRGLAVLQDLEKTD